MRVSRAYSDREETARVSRALVSSGHTVFHIHRLAATQEAHVRQLLRWFAPPFGSHILDVGSGVGGVASYMAAARPDLQFTLLNISAEQLELAPERFRAVTADAHAMPLPDGGFDATMLCYVLGHLDIAPVFSECARVTRPGGALYLYDLAGADPRRLLEVLDYEVRPIEAIAGAAAAAGLSLERTLEPEDTYIAHFADVMGHEEFDRTFTGIRPTLAVFRR